MKGKRLIIAGIILALLILIVGSVGLYRQLPHGDGSIEATVVVG